MQFKRFFLILVGSLLVFILSVYELKAQAVIRPSVFDNKAAFDAYNGLPPNSGCTTFKYAATSQQGRVCQDSVSTVPPLPGMSTFLKSQYDSLPKTGCLKTTLIKYTDNFVTATKCSPCQSTLNPPVC